jgi:hypothetical protein
MTIAKMTGVANKDELIEKMIKDIRKNRCRSLSEEDVGKLLDEVAEEMEGGRNMFKFLIDETIADTYPRKEDKWDDLK